MNIKLINGQYADLNIQSTEAKAHFVDPYNYTAEILDEFEQDPYKDIITPNDKVILDIGANIGLFALHVSPYADVIFCIEPTPEHMAIQKQILSHQYNHPSNIFKPPLVVHERSALNSYTGKARFRKEAINTTMNTLSDRPDSYEVDCITLKDLCEKYKLTHVDLVKVDIEGSEFKAITVQTVSEVSGIVKKFLLETHPRSRESQDHFKGIFEECGYKADYVDFNGSIIAYK